MNKITLLLLFLSVTFANAQSSWKKIDSENYNAKTELEFRKTTLNKFDLYSLDSDSFKNELTNNSTISIPVNGTLANFHLKETSNFTNPLSTEYGYIKSFTLKGIDDQTATGKISFGTNGAHVIIFSGKHNTLYIDPYTKDKTTYITYNKSNIENQAENFTCLLGDTKTILNKVNSSKSSQKNANDGKLRTYRLALASTVEYSQFHINNEGLNNSASDSEKKAAVLSGMNTTMTRINGVFEKELAVHFNIVVNSSGENELIFIDSDNLSNDDASSLLDESQEICDDIIGSANYDIGHTFSTGAGGLAYLGVLCENGSKGGGVTGTTSPTGDAFDIDLVAHEIGHQLGANHSFNNSCDGNRNNSTAVEPGSGSTIMGYAGICPTNVQNVSDDYFHSVSIDQMWAVIESTSCAEETDTNNTAPIVNAGNDVSVPKSTPLILRGEATDQDSNSLTYCWEQTDTEIATMPPLATNTAGPAFRSLAPTDSSDRYLPTLATVIDGNTATEWEVIPSIEREMNFSLVVRDNHSNGGASQRDDIKITVIDTDPFTVTSPNTAVNWEVGANETITWDKSTTDQQPINCENVRITLSTDGGETFPITLTESTANDGSYNITVPFQLTDSARIMIEGIDNIFYNVNTTNFSIISSGPIFVMDYISDDSLVSQVREICNSNTTTVTYDVDVNFINNFSETVTFSIENLPDGVLATFSPENINSSNEISVTLNSFENTPIGEYTLLLKGTSTSLNGSIELPSLKINSNEFEELSLISPINNAVNVTSINTTFEWNDTDFNATFYDIDIALDSSFNNIIISEQNLTDNFYTISEILDFATTYYWRVQPKNNCGNGNYATTYSFTTENSGYCTSTFTATTESEFISNVTFNTINNNSGDDNLNTVADGYEDFTNISTNLTIGTTHELTVTLDPLGFQDHCYAFIDWDGDTRFNTTTERYDLGNYIGGETTTEPYEITVPEDAVLGETRMRILIEYYTSTETYGEGACDTDHNSEFGETEDYTVNITNNTLSYDLFENVSLELYLEEGIVKLNFEIPNIEETVLRTYDLSGRLIQTNTYNDEPVNLSHLQSAIYILNIQNGDNQTSKKIYIK